MRKLAILTIILVSGVFTSCTDSNEENIQDQTENNIQSTGGEEDPIEPEDDL